MRAFLRDLRSSSRDLVRALFIRLARRYDTRLAAALIARYYELDLRGMSGPDLTILVGLPKEELRLLAWLQRRDRAVANHAPGVTPTVKEESPGEHEFES